MSQEPGPATAEPTLQRWQYAVINIGSFKSLDRMVSTLATAGEEGWELITIMDKASNWLGGLEKGFMLLKRPVPDGLVPDDGWCISLSSTGQF